MPKNPNFRNLEKEKYLELKSELFSKEAQAKGTYRHRQYDFCLADGHSDENLHSSFRLEAIKYFADRHIPWHDGCNDPATRTCYRSELVSTLQSRSKCFVVLSLALMLCRAGSHQEKRWL
jgi:hypothetical protein